MELLGTNQTQFAKIAGIYPSYVSQILKGVNKNLGKSTARRLSQKLGLDEEWLRTGAGEAPTDLVIKAKNDYEYMVDVEIVELAGAGHPYEERNDPDNDNKPIETKQFPEELVKECKKAVKISGDSMYPLIRDGAYVGVDFDDRAIVTGDVYCLYLEHEGYTVKELHNEASGVVVHAYNDRIKDYLLPHDYLERGMVVGRIRWIFQDV